MSFNDSSVTMTDDAQHKLDSSNYHIVWDTLVSPRRAFDRISRKPNWLLPFILCIIAVLAFNLLSSTYKMKDLKANLLNNSSLSASEIERRVQNIDRQLAEGSSNKINTIVIGGMILTLIQAIKLFGLTLILWLSIKLLAKDTPFKYILSICSYSFIVFIPETVLKLILVFAKETTNIYFSPALLLPPELTDSFLFAFLNNLDIFNIWMISLLIIGLQFVSKVSKKQSKGIVFSLWGAWILITTFLGGLIQVT